MSRHAVRITARALREIDAARGWLSERSRPAAARWHAQLVEALRSLENNPDTRKGDGRISLAL